MPTTNPSASLFVEGSQHYYGIRSESYGRLNGYGISSRAEGTSPTGLDSRAIGTKARALFAYAYSTTGNASSHVTGISTSTGTAPYGVAMAAYTGGSFANTADVLANGPDSIGISAATNGLRSYTIKASASAAYSRALYAFTYGKNSQTIYAQSSGTNSPAIQAVASSSGSYGAWLRSINATGIRGETNTVNQYGIYSAGKFAATGTKSFIQPHREDASKVVKFICLEGNEAGTYFRGKARVVNGRCEIKIPREWQLVTAEDSVTIQLTPFGNTRMWIEEVGRDRIVVAGSSDARFCYIVHGVREGYEEYEAYEENTDYYRPTIRGVPFGTQYPKALREVLVKNGILNPDFTPNEATAKRLGWKLMSPDDVPVGERYWISESERNALLDEQVKSEHPSRGARQ